MSFDYSTAEGRAAAAEEFDTLTRQNRERSLTDDEQRDFDTLTRDREQWAGPSHAAAHGASPGADRTLSPGENARLDRILGEAALSASMERELARAGLAPLTAEARHVGAASMRRELIRAGLQPAG